MLEIIRRILGSARFPQQTPVVPVPAGEEPVPAGEEPVPAGEEPVPAGEEPSPPDETPSWPLQTSTPIPARQD